MTVIQAIRELIRNIMISFDPSHNDEYSKKHDYRINLKEWKANKDGTISHI